MTPALPHPPLGPTALIRRRLSVIIEQLAAGKDLLDIAQDLGVNRSTLSIVVKKITGNAPRTYKISKNTMLMEQVQTRLAAGENLSAIAKDLGMEHAALHMAMQRLGLKVKAIKHPYTLDEALALLAATEGLTLPLVATDLAERRRIAVKLVTDYKVTLAEAGGAVGVTRQAVSIWIKDAKPLKQAR